MEIPVGVEVLLLVFADGHGRDLAAVVSHEPLPQFRRQATTEFAFGHLDPRFLHGERHGRKKTTRLLLSLEAVAQAPASSIRPFYVLAGRRRDADVSLSAAVPSASAAVRSWSVFTGPPAACGDRLYATASLATAPPARRRRHVTPRRRCEAALVVA